MDRRPIANRAWAIFFARGVLGTIFFMAGEWKVFQQSWRRRAARPRPGRARREMLTATV